MNNEYELYFYFDGEQESDDTQIAPMCMKCHNGEFGYLGWYYKGKLTEYKYVCNKCHAVIKDGIEDDGQFETIEA